MEKLPGGILADIFSRLLAKQVAQMRCVCKPWNALLSETSFVKSHLHRSIHNKDEILLLIHWHSSSQSNSIAARHSHSPHLEVTNFIELPTNPLSKISYYSNKGIVNVIGSMNGLICFSNISSPLHSRDYVICIWNPSLSTILNLPPCSLPCNFCENHLQFGYDPKTDDYKVIKFTSLLEPPNMVPQVEVYSMRKGSWELISQRFPSHIINSRDDLHAYDGHIHWLCDTNLGPKQQTIVAFDLGAETFREIPLPHSIDCNVNSFDVLGVLNGKLCVMSIKDECEVWVMDVYGVAESWAKHHAFYKLSGDITPYGFTSHAGFLFKVGKKDYDFVLYDPVAAKAITFKKFCLRDGVFFKSIVKYVDSLVWIAPAKHEIPAKDEVNCCTIL